METDRAYYEKQSQQALEEGSAFHCSEPEITEVVVQLANRYLANATTILDSGCGANLDYDRFLADMGKRPICADFAMNFLRLAPKDVRISLVQADATFLPFADSSFDGVICSETIEHIPRDDCVVSEIARVLRPRSVLLVTVPNLWNASRLLQMVKQRDFAVRMMTGHLREYTPSHLRNLLRPHFTIQEWSPVTVRLDWKVWRPD